MIIEELTHSLQAYCAGSLSRRELRAWLSGFDWDDTSAEALALRPAVGQLELLVEEVAEGLRDESELQSFITETLNELPNISLPAR